MTQKKIGNLHQESNKARPILPLQLSLELQNVSMCAFFNGTHELKLVEYAVVQHTINHFSSMKTHT